jgi:hypothetical protein
MTTHRAIDGPRCPADPTHGPLLSWAGTPGYWCPHAGHASEVNRPGIPAETVRWYSLLEVEAAQAAQAQR